MKLAFLITAYLDPEQLARLIKALSGEKKENIRDFYIHIDAKVDALPFIRKVSEVNGTAHIWFLDDMHRVAVYWGGYSQVRAQLNLIDAVLNSGVNYDRIVNMTGTDYPLWSNSRISRYFEDHKDVQYIMGYNFERAENPIRRYKVERYWFFDWRRYRGFRQVESILRHAANLFFRNKKKRMEYTGYHFYYGSEYWALTRDCLEYVYQTYIKDRELQALLKTAFVPSEIYVQTILYNSSYIPKLYGSPEYGVDRVSRLAPLHYFLYEERIQEFDENDYEMLRFFDKMFFRKARTGTSDKLMDMVDLLRKSEDEEYEMGFKSERNQKGD